MKPVRVEDLIDPSGALTADEDLSHRFMVETTMLEMGLYDYCAKAKEDAEKFCRNEELVKQYPVEAAKVC